MPLTKQAASQSAGGAQSPRMVPMTGAAPTGADGTQGAQTLREALAQYPRGVVVVTGLDERGDPIGVPAAFTPASVDPPVIAILPDRTSAAFSTIRKRATFCVNLLAEDQEKLIRGFASHGSGVAGVEWRPSPSGSPILDGALSWIDCEFDDVHEVGDRLLVLGRVTSVAVERNALPLLSFQSGFGRFVPGSLSVSRDSGLLDSVAVAELAGDSMELLAQELGVECSVIALVDNHWVAVAAANHSDTAWRTRLGHRVPIVPPLGVLFVDNPGNGPTQDEWLGRLGNATDEDVALARAQLGRVRERGWSASLAGRYTKEELDSFVSAYSEATHTAEQEQDLLGAIRAMAPMHEPAEILADETYDVVNLDVPVRAPSGEVLVVLRLMELPQAALGTEITFWLSMLLEAAAAIERRIQTDAIPRS